MASNTKWREEFIARLSRDRDALPLETLRRLMRHAVTLQRLAEAQCNGDWPADNGRRPTKPCDECGMGWALETLKPKRQAPIDELCRRCDETRATADACASCPDGHDFTKRRPRSCPDCRKQAEVAQLLALTPWRPVFGGDPRGCVLKIARRRQSCNSCPTCYGRNLRREDGSDMVYCSDCAVHHNLGNTTDEDIQNGRAESRGDVIGVPA